METKPISEKELEEMGWRMHRHTPCRECDREDAPRLLAEVRRLRGLQRVVIAPPSGPLLGKEVVDIFERQQATLREMQQNRDEWRQQFYEERSKCDRIEGDLFSANVEIDNLRKQLADARAEARGFEDSLRASRRIGEEDRARILKLEAVAAAARGVLGPASERSYSKVTYADELRAALEALDPKPVPMCKPDALEDLFPPAGGNPT